MMNSSYIHGVGGPVFLFVAWLLLLLVSVSLPILQSVYLLTLSANVDVGVSIVQVANAMAQVRFGVYGYCVSSVDVSALGHTESTPGYCTQPQLGFTLDDNVSKALHVSGIENGVSRSVTLALALHPVACVLTFLALVVAVGALIRQRRAFAILTTILVILSTLFALIAFILDVVVVKVAQNRVSSATHGDVTVDYGNAVWMTLSAFILLVGAQLFACISCVRTGRNRHANPDKF